MVMNIMKPIIRCGMNLYFFLEYPLIRHFISIIIASLLNVLCKRESYKKFHKSSLLLNFTELTMILFNNIDESIDEFIKFSAD